MGFFACSSVNYTFTFTFTSPSLTKQVLQKYTFRIATAQRAGYVLEDSWIDYVYGGEFPHRGINQPPIQLVPRRTRG